MARYFINGGINNNWGDTSNWSDTSNGTGGFSIPTASDDVYLDVFSPNCVVNSTNRVCLSINFTGYTNTFSEDSTTRTLTVSGNVTLDAGAIYIFAGTLIINDTATLTSNGATWTGSLTTSTSANTTFTLADAWVVGGNFTFGNSANTHTFNGFTISIGGNLTISGSSSASGSDGTTGFIMNGTGTILHSGGTAVRTMRNPFTINTAGTITFDTNTVCFGGDFTYTAGTVITTGSTVNLNNNSGTKTIATNGITFNNVTFNNVGTTYTLSNVMLVVGTLTFGVSNSNTYTINGSSISANGDVAITITSGTIAGTTVLNINGTGSQTWSGTSSTPIRLDININKASGSLTIGTNIAYNTGTLTYTTGSVTTTGSTLTIAASTTLNTNGINWNNISFTATTPTHTLTSDLNIYGTFTQTSGSLITFNGSDIYCYGDVTVNASVNVTIAGTSDFFFAGTGIWSGGQAFDCNITITGTYTLTGTVSITGGCVFTCTSGLASLVVTSSTLAIQTNIAATPTINTNKNLNNLSVGTSTVTLLQALVCLGTLTYSNNTTTTINGFSITIGGSLTLQAGTLAVGTTNFNFNGTGTWSGSGVLRNNLTINTAGTITISGSVSYNTGTLTYTTGTVITTGSTLAVSATATLNTNGITWNNFTSSPGAPTTITLTSDLVIDGDYSGSNNSVTYNGANIYLGGNITLTAVSISNGTTNLIYNGTGTWSGTGTISEAFEINTSGTLTLSGTVRYTSSLFKYTSGTVVTTGSTLLFNSGGSIDASGITFNNFTFTGANPSTFTLISDLNVAGNFTVTANAGTVTLNSSTIYVGGSFTTTSPLGTCTGTTNIVLNGTGTWSSTATGALKNNLTINTAGIITIGSSVRYDTGTLTWVTGTVDTTTNNSTLTITTTTTLNLNDGFEINYATNPGGAPCNTHTITLLSNCTLKDVTWIIVNSNIITFNGFRLKVTGGLGMGTGSAGIVAGTTEIVAGGIGTYSTGLSQIRSNFTINTVGAITFSSTINFLYNTGTFTYTAGTVVTTGNTLIIGASTTLNTAGINWNNISISSTSTITNTSTLTISGTLTYNSGSAVTLNVSNVNVGGITYASNSNSSGTSLIIFNGTGTWNTTGAGYLRNNITINTSGTLTFGTIIRYDTGTFTYISGTVDTATNISSIHINASTTFDTEGMIFYNFVPLGSATNITLNSHLNVTNLIQFANINHNWIGTSAFTCGTLYLATITAARTYTLLTGVTYSILSDFVCTLTNNNMKSIIRSDTPATRAVLVLGETASQNIGYLNATDIDSSAGQTIYSANGVLNNTLNWGILATPSNINVGSTFTFY